MDAVAAEDMDDPAQEVDDGEVVEDIVEAEGRDEISVERWPN